VPEQLFPCADYRYTFLNARNQRSPGETMLNSRSQIQTSHVGSLPRPDDLIEANRAREAGDSTDEAGFQKILHNAVADVVRAQKQAGISIPNDGEFGKSMGQRVNYRAWAMYAYSRLDGLSPEGAGPMQDISQPARPGEIVLKSIGKRRDRVRFAGAYNDPESGVYMGPGAMSIVRPACVAPVRYTGHAAIKADIDNFKAALKANGYKEGFMTSVAPGSVSRLLNRYYKTDEEFMFACADAMREEYKAIVDAGLVLQLDDPSVAENWDSIDPAPSVAAYRKFSMRRVEALNRAIRGLPEDRIRFHLCWGSWHGPHTTDLPMKDIIDVMLKVKCQAYSFEAANARHEHEWSVWKDVKLPAGKIVIPGIVGHATNVVEHPDLVAERIVRFANVVGKENVIAATDCGLGGRIHPEIAWAKLEALAEGAKRASKQLWRKGTKTAKAKKAPATRAKKAKRR
jgi:5-methyltetrahydropteroyltriglutamate--homocysteine methyltransferase